MKFYRKQPIEAEQFDGSNEMIERYDMGFQLAPNGKGGAIIKTLEGGLLVHVSDWIVKDADRVKVLTDEEFKQQYAGLPVIHKEVADWIERGKSKHIDLDTVLMLVIAARADAPEVTGASKLIWSTHMADIAIAWAIGYQGGETNDWYL